MENKVKIPYLGIEYDADFFFMEGIEATKELIAEYGDEITPEDILCQACRDFSNEWGKLNSKFGHLYGLFEDCIEPQLREILGFPPSESINQDRRRIYFECRHKDAL